MEKYKVIERSKATGSTYSLLNKGMVPGIIYGKGTEPIQIAFEDKILQKLMHTGSFYSTILDIDIEGKIEKILPKQLQYHPVTDKLIHFDFLRVQNETKVTVEVPVQFLNQETCPGLKKGGVLNLVRRDVELSCNANNIPDNLQFDLESSEIGDSIKISNIDLPEGIKPTISDRDFVIATLAPPTVEVETKPAEAEEEVTEENKDEKTETKEETKEESK
ncbi:MAG: 50S ribosomal protein L25/general stress protein Ctc [Pelagibacteraceae bacterium]|jgi:large subunit ribosomal protein L25|nr:50S ribosomal protein L25/general stress protein Ctc [Pelagibacteraceae bacterium]MBT3901875.1 50S ribosomal protein L25/general stress protein Ctc [Pelagibacteraceae bacterium]